jgi:Na+/H+-dicarboxylate symporter
MTSPASRALIGLTAGLVVGSTIVWSHAAAAHVAVAVLDPVGTVWVNALRMTVVPLVVSLLVSTLASGNGLSTVGTLGRRAMVVFLALLVGMTIVGLVLAPPVYSLLHVDPASAAALRASTAADLGKTPTPGFASWVVSLVPANVFQAASDGAMLPLIVFAAAFGLALARIPEQLRVPLVAVFRTLADAMLVIVSWVLQLAPIGAFALAVTLTAHLGNATASAMLFYLVSHAALLVLVGAMLYLIVPPLARTSIARFARAMLPAEVVVVSTRSSLAALPAMLESAEHVLEIPAPVSSFVLPLGVSLLRASTGLSWIVYALFLGKLYGVPLTITQLAELGAVAIAMSFSVPGIPSGGLLIATPYFAALGIPAQGIGVLIALDAIPDIFKTLVIVVSHMSATLLVARRPIRTDTSRPSRIHPMVHAETRGRGGIEIVDHAV